MTRVIDQAEAAFNPSSLPSLPADIQIEKEIERGNWPRVFELAGKGPEGQLQKYVSQHGHAMAKEGRFRDALNAFAK